MSAGDVFLLVIRWLHLLSAAAWIGGSLFYLLVLRPSLRRSPQAPETLATIAAREFRVVVNTCIVVLIATGVILAFDRLAEGVVDAPYAITLGLKSALTLWMFMLAWSHRRRTVLLEGYHQIPRQSTTGLGRIGRAASGYNALLVLGVVVLFLSDLLKVLFEGALSRG